MNTKEDLKLVDKQTCLFGNKDCKEEYNDYKKVCNAVWDQKCTPYLDHEKLEEIKNLAEECRLRRIEFNKNCCFSKIDERHLDAIHRMENIVDECEYEEGKRENS